jgi:4-coumarate--CoA ligase
MAKHPIVDQYDMSKLEQVFSGAAPLSAELALEAGSASDCEVVQGYGMTELSPVSHLTPAGQFKPGSVGVTAPNTEMRIVDPLTGDDLDVDADGEIWVRGPQVMKGYLNNERATADTITDDGWLRTGDIGHVDATATSSSSTGSRSSSSTRASRWPRPSWRPCCSPIRPSRTPP